jgi:alcohol dehydrogenase class IV
MQIPAGEFSFTRLEKVIFGAGSIAKVGHELDRRGLMRAVVVTGKSLGASGLLDQVTGALGARCAGVFKGISQHVPMQSVRALTEELRRLEAGAVVSFGGGSPIDASKVAIASILNGRDMTLAGGELDWSQAMAPRGHQTPLLHVAIPTTLSAAEYTPAGGTTDEATRVKRGVLDARLQPAVIINDPVLTLATPDWLWVATGIRALDHAVEAIYSTRHQLFTDALAAKAIRLLFAHLPGSIRSTGDEQLAHRGYCQMAAWFSLYGAINVRLGIMRSATRSARPGMCRTGSRHVSPCGTGCGSSPRLRRSASSRLPTRSALRLMRPIRSRRHWPVPTGSPPLSPGSRCQTRCARPASSARRWCASSSRSRRRSTSPAWSIGRSRSMRSPPYLTPLMID